MGLSYAASMSDPQPDPHDETKRKFREALERKQAKAAGGGVRQDGGPKQNRAHGPAANRREFRRKSG